MNDNEKKLDDLVEDVDPIHRAMKDRNGSRIR